MTAMRLQAPKYSDSFGRRTISAATQRSVTILPMIVLTSENSLWRRAWSVERIDELIRPKRVKTPVISIAIIAIHE